MPLRSMPASKPGRPCGLDARDRDISESRLKTLCDRDAVSLGVRAAGKSAGADGVRPAMLGLLAGVCGNLTLGADGDGLAKLGVLARSGRAVALGADGADRVMLGADGDGDGLAKLGVLARSGRAVALGSDGADRVMLGADGDGLAKLGVLARSGRAVILGADGADRVMLGADGDGLVKLGVLARSGRAVTLGADGADRVMLGADGDGLAKRGVLEGDCRVVALGADRDRIGLDDEFAGPRIAGDEKGETAGVLRAGVREVGAPWNERTLPLDRDRLGIAGDEDRLGLLGERLMLGAGERDAGIDLADGVGADRDIDAEGLDGARAAGWDRPASPDDRLNDWPRPRDGDSAAGDSQVIVKTVNRTTHPPRDAQPF